MAYKEVRFTDLSQNIIEILIAELSELQYEGFEEEDNQLKAFIPEISFDEKRLKQLSQQFSLSYTATTLPDTNWNQVWESNFQPVTVDNFCAVRAEFHEPAKDVQYEIVITPKMSFGTGHHPTTYMMIQQMEGIDFKNKLVMDFGTGTGVLAILAEKLGAKSVLAIDNDDWCIKNAEENLLKNKAVAITLKKADTAAADTSFDIILANITRNIILDNFSLFVSHLAKNGILLLSGLLIDDEQAILNEAIKNNFVLENKIERNNWICMKFKYVSL